jgi:hypothetical protein
MWEVMIDWEYSWGRYYVTRNTVVYTGHVMLEWWDVGGYDGLVALAYSCVLDG